MTVSGAGRFTSGPNSGNGAPSFTGAQVCRRLLHRGPHRDRLLGHPRV